MDKIPAVAYAGKQVLSAEFVIVKSGYLDDYFEENSNGSQQCKRN